MLVNKFKIDTELENKLEQVEMNKGEILLESGEKPKGFYLVSSELLNDYPAAEEKSWIALGLKELILDQPSDRGVKLSGSGTGYFISSEKFKTLFETTESFPRSISRLLSSQSGIHTDFKRVKRLEKLVEASRIVNSTLDLNKLLKIILNIALKSVNADRGTVYLYNEEKNELWSKVFDGKKSVTIRLPVGKGIAGKVAETGEIMNITNAVEDDRFNSEIDKETGYKTETILCMPLKNKEGKMLGVFQLLNKKNGVFTEDDEQFIETLSINVASALENARLYEQEQKKIAMEKEMLAASEVQKNLFPSIIPEYPDYEIAAINIPARMTSGDLYDFFELDDKKLVFSLGDVSGKGLPAAILMANLQSVLKDLPHQNPSPSFCVTRSNDIINRVSSSGKFITLFLGLLDMNEHKLIYSNAGHEYPYLMRNGNTERLKTGGIPIGIMAGSTYEEQEYDVKPGDVLLVFSDGVNDATNEKDDYFSEKRLEELVSTYREQNPKQIIDKVCNEISTFTGDTPQFDDITLMIIKRLK